MDEVEPTHQHEDALPPGDLPEGSLLVLDHRHEGGDRWHRHNGFELAQLVVTEPDGTRTVYGPDGQVRWSGPVEAPPVHPQVLGGGTGRPRAPVHPQAQGPGAAGSRLL